ncbi:MAG: nucleoside recognition protein [Candidatus Neomarinimicrobiota bacterium]|nr:nucleoside recognition protein [Candidatus Neomarinimicrobiota bacterium]RKY47885.1 MAG: nucleoside recognition protein [Candidatus Neomarinimicrobiota bacterium]HDN60099.1 nucleoside recognition protein [Candidatus Neomarinimicrobiota bacterium]
MLNYIWLFLMLVSILVGAVNGRLGEVTKAAVDSASTAVEISLGLIGIMALWLGIMKIAEKGGIIRVLARLIRPIGKFLFPRIPEDHPAIGLMLMNLVANWLGLGNAATPLGLKAMESLQSLNKKKDTATNAMVVFLALNTASICIIPMTIIAVRTELGSKNPFEIISTTFLASLCATIAAVTAAKLLQRLPSFKKTDPDLEEERKDEDGRQ